MELGGANDMDLSYSTRTLGEKNFELTNHLGNVLAVVSDKKILNEDNTTYRADVISTTDYYPFGMGMPARSYKSAGYRFGFNGQETETEITGTPSHLDFGARIYDSRTGRFLSIDPKVNKFPNITPYNYAINSPLLFIDNEGEDPRVAIIIESNPNEFNDHYKPLKAQGYTVVYAKTGQEALELMGQYSSPESPIENLVIISHGSPGGASNGSMGGIYTQMEISGYAIGYAYGTMLEERISSIPGEVDDETLLAIEEETRRDVLEIFSNPSLSDKKEEMINGFKQKTGAITSEDIKNAISSNDVFVKDLKIVMGGCNTAGYATLDEQDIFTTELATTTKSDVYGAQGFSAPINNTSKRKADKTWIKTDASGNRRSTGSNIIDLGNPE